MTRLGLCVVAASAGLAFGQPPPADDATNPAAPPATPPAATPDAPPTADVRAKRDRMLRAARLPKEAHECRQKGVPDEDMKAALRNAKRKGLKADETADITTEQRRAIDEHGPVDNFGAFVQSKLDEGLRGRELAAAIKAEHAKRGKGKGYKKPKDDTARGKGKGKDRDDATDPTTERPGSEKGKGKGGG